MIRGEHVECMGDNIKAYKILVGKRKARDHLGDLGMYGKMILKWIIKVGCEGVDGINLFQQRPVEGSYDYGTVPSGFIKGGKRLD
jgi:hypothetical protein